MRGVGPYPENLPPNSPLRYTRPPGIDNENLLPNAAKCSTTFVNYPKRDLMSYKDECIWLTTEMSSHGALAHMGTTRNMQEWRMKIDIKQNFHLQAIHLVFEPGQFIKQTRRGHSKSNWELTADHLCEQYKWTNKHQIVERPRRKIAVDAIAYCDTTDSEFEKLKNAWDYLDCGREFRDYLGKTIPNKKVGEEKPTHIGYVSAFDPEVDVVPGN